MSIRGPLSILIAALAALFATPSASLAQVYPSRPISIVVPFAPGGATDVLPRLIGEHLHAVLGQPVIIENVSGAGGTIGIGRVARSAPDGYTIASGNWSTFVSNGAIYSLPYDLIRDFEPVVLLQANQDKVTVGTAGVGTGSHFAAILLQHLTDTHFPLIHYRGGGPALQDLLGGQIDLMTNQAAVFLPQWRAGSIKIYAALAENRLPQAPDIPTADEAGLPGFHVSVWNGFWAPKGTPGDTIARLNAAVLEVLAMPDVHQRLIELAYEFPSHEQETPAALGALQRSEIEKWWPIIKAANIKGD
jgi:tripartite-type tricarboxylate transporter receptor subunit TctC